MTKRIDDIALGRLIAELLELHWEACNNSEHPAFEIEGYESEGIDSIDIVGGDHANISVQTSTGREFRITVTAAYCPLPHDGTEGQDRDSYSDDQDRDSYSA